MSQLVIVLWTFVSQWDTTGEIKGERMVISAEIRIEVGANRCGKSEIEPLHHRRRKLGFQSGSMRGERLGSVRVF
jgi:hypothetical protein